MVKNIIRLLVLIELAKSKCHDQANNFQIGKQKVTMNYYRLHRGKQQCRISDVTLAGQTYVRLPVTANSLERDFLTQIMIIVGLRLHFKWPRNA